MCVCICLNKLLIAETKCWNPQPPETRTSYLKVDLTELILTKLLLLKLNDL